MGESVDIPQPPSEQECVSVLAFRPFRQMLKVAKMQTLNYIFFNVRYITKNQLMSIISLTFSDNLSG